MKNTYRTEEGDIIELTEEEFLHYPFNVRLTLIYTDPVEAVETEPKPIRGRKKRHKEEEQ